MAEVHKEKIKNWNPFFCDTPFSNWLRQITSGQANTLKRSTLRIMNSGYISMALVEAESKRKCRQLKLGWTEPVLAPKCYAPANTRPAPSTLPRTCTPPQPLFIFLLFVLAAEVLQAEYDLRKNWYMLRGIRGKYNLVATTPYSSTKLNSNNETKTWKAQAHNRLDFILCIETFDALAVLSLIGKTVVLSSRKSQPLSPPVHPPTNLSATESLLFDSDAYPPPLKPVRALTSTSSSGSPAHLAFRSVWRNLLWLQKIFHLE